MLKVSSDLGASSWLGAVIDENGDAAAEDSSAGVADS